MHTKLPFNISASKANLLVLSSVTNSSLENHLSLFSPRMCLSLALLSWTLVLWCRWLETGPKDTNCWCTTAAKGRSCDSNISWSESCICHVLTTWPQTICSLSASIFPTCNTGIILYFLPYWLIVKIASKNIFEVLCPVGKSYINIVTDLY